MRPPGVFVVVRGQEGLVRKPACSNYFLFCPLYNSTFTLTAPFPWNHVKLSRFPRLRLALQSRDYSFHPFVGAQPLRKQRFHNFTFTIELSKVLLSLQPDPHSAAARKLPADGCLWDDASELFHQKRLERSRLFWWKSWSLFSAFQSQHTETIHNIAPRLTVEWDSVLNRKVFFFC